MIIENIIKNPVKSIVKSIIEVPEISDPVPGWEAFYKMDILDGSVIVDESGNHNGSALAGVVLDTGLLGNCFRFVRGTTSQGNLYNIGGGDITLSLFFKTSNIATTTQYLFGDTATSSHFVVWNSSIGGLGNKLLFNNQVWGGGLLIGHYIDLGVSLVNNQWYHFVWTYNSSTNQNEVFLDAVSKGTRIGVLPTTTVENIGNFAASPNGLLGRIDYMKIYTSVLDISDILLLKAEGLP